VAAAAAAGTVVVQVGMQAVAEVVALVI